MSDLPETGSLAQVEMAANGAVLIDPPVYDRMALSGRDFSNPGLGQLFNALGILCEARKPITDATWLTAELRRMGVAPDLCTQVALFRMVNAAVNSAHATDYADQIRTAARLREWAGIAADLQAMAADPKARPERIAQWLDSKSERLHRSNFHESVTIHQAAEAAIADMEAAASGGRVGAMTGMDGLDSAAGATMLSELLVIAARTGCGKTVMGLQIAAHNAERGRPALVVSLEMKDKELAKRKLAGMAGVDSRDMRAGTINHDERRRVRTASDELIGVPLRIWAPPHATLPEIRAASRHAKATTGLQLLVVDYIQIVRPTADERRMQRHEQIGAVTAGLKSLAKELDIVVVALAQLKRDADNEEPKLSHLRESGSIEQDADAVWLIHHPPASGRPVEGPVYACGAHLIIAKHRHGETGRVRVLWHPTETRFSSSPQF